MSAVVAVALLAPNVALGQDGVSTAVAWLRTEPTATGGWAGEERLFLRDTAEVLHAFDLAAPGDAALPAARDALGATTSISVDREARRLEALSGAGGVPSEILEGALAELLARRARRIRPLAFANVLR